MSPRLFSVTALALLVPVLAPRASHAQTETPGGGVALNQFDPAPAGDTFFGVPSPQTNGHLVPRALIAFDDAHRPLVAALDGATNASGAVVSAQAFLHVGASLALWNRLLVSASFPLAVLQQGDSPTIGGTTFSSPSGVQAGDLRLGARVKLFGESDDVFQMAAGATFYAPTGPDGAFTGDGGVRIAPELVFGGRASMIAWSAAVRPTFHASDNPSTITYGAALAFLLFNDRLRVGPEFWASSPVQDGLIRLRDNKTIARGLTSNAEVWLGVRGNVFGGLWIGAAGGPGLTDAMGTPSFRAMGLLAWSPEVQKPKVAAPVVTDTDSDGLIDSKDLCPYAFGEKNGCPVIDGDEDGVEDKDDACPAESGATGANPKRNGCPADRDEDGVPDAVDVCPDGKGDPAQNGCASKPAAG